MRIRLTGTQAECDRFTTELVAATAPGVVREVSGFYPNRGTDPRTQVVLGRVYLDIAMPAEPAMPPESSGGVPAPTPARRAVPGAAALARGEGEGRPRRRRGSRGGDGSW